MSDSDSLQEKPCCRRSLVAATAIDDLTSICYRKAWTSNGFSFSLRVFSAMQIESDATPKMEKRLINIRLHLSWVMTIKKLLLQS